MRLLNNSGEAQDEPYFQVSVEADYQQKERVSTEYSEIEY